MALPTIAEINGKKIAQVASALYGAQIGATTNAAVLADIAAYGFDTTLNTYYTYSFGDQTAAQVAATMVGNVGITTAAGFAQADVDAAVAYVTAQIAAVPGAEGAAIASALNAFAGLTTDPVYGAAATAWNASIVNAMAYTASGATADVANGTSGATVALTTGVDAIMGTVGNDMFNAYIADNANTLNSGDVIDGGTGTDTLYADIGSAQAFAITPHLTGVENVTIRSQSTVTDATNGNNMVANTVQIDAQRATGVTHWTSDNSRSDVVIEDVRIADGQKTKDITITFAESDPGNVDFGVYFDQLSLRNSGSSSSQLVLQAMDTGAAGTAATAATPLLNYPNDTFKFSANGVMVSLSLGDMTNVDDYDALLAKVNDALAADPVTFNGITATKTGTFTIVDPITTNSVTGSNIVLTSTGGVVIDTPTGSGWFNTLGASVPAIANMYNSWSTSTTGTQELVTSTIVLDNVGRGSTGGDLVVGGLSVGDTSTSRGVERFEITVNDNSKLQTINSTNNALREVVIVNGVTSNTSASSYYTGQDAYTATADNAGNLTVNGTAATADTQLAGVENGSAVGNHAGATAKGFTDVRVIDGSAMTGKLAFTAGVTSDSIAKYVDLVDVATSPTADVASAGNTNFNKLGANFAYTGGSNDDTMDVTIDAAVAASNSSVVVGQSDFTFAVAGGAGNDAITVDLVDSTNTLVGNTEAWYTNQKLNANISINAGSGNDTVRTPGAGDIIIDASAGNDTVYTDNTGSVVGTWDAAAAATNNAVWVFNATAAGKALADIESTANTTYGMFGSTLTVTYRGLTSTVNVTNTSYNTSDLQVNQAIKNAINSNAVLSKLLLAEDGPANTLVVTSLTDGVRVATDLDVTMTASTATVGASDITGYVAAHPTVAANSAAVLADMAANVTTFNAAADYTSAFATGGGNLVGVNSASTSDNTITGGTGDDVIVLGTTDNTTTAVGSSNETVVYNASGFGNDTVVNFGSNVTAAVASAEVQTLTFGAVTVGGAGNITVGGFTAAVANSDTATTVATAVAAALNGQILTGTTVAVVAGAVGGVVTLTFDAADGNVAQFSTVETSTMAAPTAAATPTPGVTGVTGAFGGDQFNFTGLNGDMTTQVNLTALVTTDKSINVVALVSNGDAVVDAGENDSAAAVTTLLAGSGMDDATASSHVYIVYDTANVASVYTVADGTGAADASATLVGTIDLADTLWSSLTTANFV